MKQPNTSVRSLDTTGLSRIRPKLIEALQQLPRPVRSRALNALDGFDRADRLLESDREMASFRAITAQEEAAAAIFRALQLQNYPGAERLKIGDHRHKAAIYPFMDAVRAKIFADVGSLTFTFELSVKPPSIAIKIPLAALGVTHPELVGFAVQPVYPLHLLSSQDGVPYQFEKEFSEITSATSRNKVDRFVKRLANQRNTLLYAGDQSAPESKATSDDLRSRRAAAEALLYLCIAVMQTSIHQHLVIQSLEAFLKVLGVADGLVIAYEKLPSPDVTFTARKAN